MIMQALLKFYSICLQFYGYLKIQVLVEQLVKLLNLIQFISWLNHIVHDFIPRMVLYRTLEIIIIT